MNARAAQASASRVRGLAYGLAGGLSLSVGGVLIRFVESANSWQVIAYRSAFLGLAVTLLCLARHRFAFFQAYRAIGWPGLVAAVILALGYPTYVLALLNTTIANALFLLSTAPLIAALLGWLILREHVRRSTWAAIFGTVLGVLVMVYEGMRGGGLFGNVMALGAALTFAVYTIAIRWSRGVDMLPALSLAGFLAAGMGVIGGGGEMAVSDHDFALCAGMGVQAGLGFMFYTLSARHITAAEINLLAMGEVVLGPVWVWLVIGEVPTELTLAGGAIVLASVFSFAILSVQASRRRG
jgi:drug/metabolite transporter (DMT)-like permease